MPVSKEIIGDVELIVGSDTHFGAKNVVTNLDDIEQLPIGIKPQFLIAYHAIETVCDPEIPVLTIMDLGVFRSLSIGSNEHVITTITPTYSGCPAMSMIAFDVEVALNKAGFDTVSVNLSLKPAWTTDWMTQNGKTKLVEYGIAAPIGKSDAIKTGRAALFGITEVACPRCKSSKTEKLAEFGSTACKAQYRCLDCLEPFDYFKCI